MRRARRTIARFTLMLFALTVVAIGPANADDAPSVRLFSVADHLDVHKDRRGQVYLDPGVWVASVGGAFELQASRPDYDSPATFVQVDHETGDVVRTLPSELAEGWLGLAHFIHVTVRDAQGNLVARAQVPFCPNQYGRSRLVDDGPLNPTYPSFCGGSPFTLGTVFGIDEGWASPVFGDYYYGNGISFQAPGRHFTMTAWIDNTWAGLLGADEQPASAPADFTAATPGDSTGAPTPPVPSKPGRALARAAAAVPVMS